jgi:hypothetical protein
MAVVTDRLAREVVVPPHDREYLELLRAMLAELQAIRAAVEQPRRPLTVTRADRAYLVRLLPAVGGVFGSESFAARDLLEHDSAAVRLVVDGSTAKKLGQLLRRAEGHPIDGLMVERSGIELGVVLWQIVAC